MDAITAAAETSDRWWTRPHHYVRNIGSATSLAAGAIHDVSGAGVGPAVSIHAYSPPLRAMNYYAHDEGGHLSPLQSALSDAPEEEVVR